MDQFDSLDKIDEILSKCYPTQEKLKSFPLGEKLVKLDTMAWTNEIRYIILNESELCILDTPETKPHQQNERITQSVREKGHILENEYIFDVFRRHIKECMEGIQILTGGGDIAPFFDEDFRMGVEPYKSFLDFLNTLTIFDRKFLRFVTLYHDIGKVIHRDKHPMLSKHILESIEDRARKRFIRILGDESYFYLMLDLVGHHDLFGTICTGESSRTSLIEASGLRLKQLIDAKKTIDYLVVLNLSDMYGTIGSIPKERLSLVAEEQVFFDKMIPTKKSKKTTVFASFN